MLSYNQPNGCCTDNAEVESFVHSLKGDLIRANVITTTNNLHLN